MPDQPESELAERYCNCCFRSSRDPVRYGAPCTYPSADGPCPGVFTEEPLTRTINPANDRVGRL